MGSIGKNLADTFPVNVGLHFVKPQPKIFSPNIQNFIRFSQPIAFNDPFEFKPVIESTLSIDEVQDEIDKNFDKLIQSKIDELPLELRTMLIGHDLKKWVRDQINNNQGWIKSQSSVAAKNVSSTLTNFSNQLVGVLSLTEKRENLLMWSHYADSHKGFCIGFDSSHHFFNRKRSEKDEFYHLRKVDYIKKRPSKALRQTNSTDLFLLKSDVWEYEQEWRICSVLKDADQVLDGHPPKVHLFKYPQESVMEILIGANATQCFTDELLKIVKSDAKFSHVKIMKCKESETEYALNIVKL